MSRFRKHHPGTGSSLVQPEGSSLQAWMETRIARYSTRKYDWDALKFQADFDPKFRRAQMRYVGTGGTGVAADVDTVPAENFTFSTMVIPAGHEGPPHLHIDVEEVFFLIRGKLKLVLVRHHDTGKRAMAMQYPHRALVAPRVRATVDYLLEKLKADPALQLTAAQLQQFT